MLGTLVKVQGRYRSTLNRHQESDALFLLREFVPHDSPASAGIIVGVAGPRRHDCWRSVGPRTRAWPAEVRYHEDSARCTAAAGEGWTLLHALDEGEGVRAL